MIAGKSTTTMPTYDVVGSDGSTTGHRGMGHSFSTGGNHRSISSVGQQEGIPGYPNVVGGRGYRQYTESECHTPSESAEGFEFWRVDKTPVRGFGVPANVFHLKRWFRSVSPKGVIR